MYYINSTPTENGNYGNPSSKGQVVLPDEFLSAYLESMGFVHITVENNTVTSITRNEEAYDAYIAEHPAYVPTASEQREEAYNTEKLITWGEKTLTVTEAAQLWQYYAAEGDEAKTAELSALIAAAKAEIRAAYPDTESEE